MNGKQVLLAKYNYFKNLELKNQLKFGIILGKNWGFFGDFWQFSFWLKTHLKT
jgi:hypothetical protein